MHCLFMKYELTDVLKEVDHIDGNGVNNRRSNLRPVTSRGNNKNQKMNIRNTSGVTGVLVPSRYRAMDCRMGGTAS